MNTETEKKKFIDAANSSLIDGWADEEIDIRSHDLEESEFLLPFTKKGSFKEKFYNKNLVVKNCTNLKILDLQGLKLAGLKIENCPELETLIFSHNQIKNFDLTGLDKLKDLYCSGNQLTKLDLTVLKECEKEYEGENGQKYTKTAIHLRNLICDNNPIKELEVKHLTELENLICCKCGLAQLDCSDLENLEELNCASACGWTRDFTSLVIKNNKNLKILDCAENLGLKKINLINFPKLEFVSCKISSIGLFQVEGCPNLDYLDFSMQYFANWNEMKRCWDPIRFSVSPDSRNNLKSLFYSENSNVIHWTHFPKLRLLEIDQKEVPEFEEYLVKERKKEQRSYQKDNFPKYRTDNENQAWLDKWLELKAKKDKKYLNNLEKFKNNLKSLDLSWRKLKDKFVIKDYPKLKFLNLGNNLLNEIVIVNCPELEIVNASHNPLTGHIKKINCPKINKIYYFYDKSSDKFYDDYDDYDDYDEIDEDEGYESDEDNSEKNTEKLVNFLNNPNATAEELVTLKLSGVDDSLKDKLLVLAEKLLPPLTYDELIQLNIKNIPGKIARTFAEILTRKFKEKQEKEAVLAFINNPNATIKELLKLNLKNVEVSVKVEFLKFAEKFLSEFNLKQLKLTLGKLKDIETNDNHQLLARIIIKLIRKKLRSNFPELCEFKEKKTLKTKAAINLAITQLKVNKENYSKERYQEILTSLEKQYSELKKKENLSFQNSQRDDSVFSPLHLIYGVIFAFIIVLALVYWQNKKNKN